MGRKTNVTGEKIDFQTLPVFRDYDDVIEYAAQLIHAGVNGRIAQQKHSAVNGTLNVVIKAMDLKLRSYEHKERRRQLEEFKKMREKRERNVEKIIQDREKQGRKWKKAKKLKKLKKAKKAKKLESEVKLAGKNLDDMATHLKREANDQLARYEKKKKGGKSKLKMI